MSDYYYNITKTEKGILIKDRFFTHEWDGFIYNYGKNEAGVPTNLGDLKFETIQLSRIQIEPDPDPDDIFFIIEDVIFSLNNEDFYRNIYGIKDLNEIVNRIQKHLENNNISISKTNIMKYLKNNL
jgi:hypothetical protein